MDNANVQPVVLCGGSGTRLWPLSRSGFPKQFVSLNAEASLFQQTILRLQGLGANTTKPMAPIFVTGEEHRFLVAEQLRELGLSQTTTLLEPCSRDTAPALTIAALAAHDLSDDPVLVVTPSDHLVSDDIAFKSTIQSAVQEALKGVIVVFGIEPDHPETGFGYIQVGAELAQKIFDVSQFVEKPDEVTAKSYLKQGGYYWNSGIFVLKASIWLEAISYFRPDIYKATEASWKAKKVDASFIRPGQSEFAAVPRESIDYAVIERCPSSKFALKMMVLNVGWSDVGSWNAVWQHMPKDEMGNTSLGDAFLDGCRNTLVHASSRLVSVIGAKDLAVIETPDSVLVVDMRQSQDVKKFVQLLQQSAREEQTLHRKVCRPWGWYDVLDVGEKFKVKRIKVESRASLSLQKHHHRAEHWIVVKGVATVTIEDKTFLLQENESTFIEAGKIHSLSNQNATPLEIIEVQSGDYLGEDDIIRIADTYGRDINLVETVK